ncbi:MAG: hypothetical protein ACTSVA_02915 [Candidatus Njordarchaeales archaeon]
MYNLWENGYALWNILLVFDIDGILVEPKEQRIKMMKIPSAEIMMITWAG